MLPISDYHEVKDNEFLPPRNRHYPMTVVYSLGGIDIGNYTQGLAKYVWKAYIEDDTIYVEREDKPSTKQAVLTKQNITQLDLAFDQSMRVFLTYVADNKAYYYGFNAQTSDYQEIQLAKGIEFPRCSIDFHEQELVNRSDVILGYVRGENLCYRVQRERFTKEHVIASNANKSMLWRIGRTKDNRFGFMWR